MPNKSSPNKSSASRSLPNKSPAGLTEKWGMQAFDQLPWASWITTPSGDVIKINELGQKLLSQLKIPLKDPPFPIQDLLKQFDIGNLATRKTLQSRWQGEWFYQRNKLSQRYKVFIVPIKLTKEHAKGELVGISYHLDNITEQASQEQNLVGMQEQLQASQTDLENMFDELCRVNKLGDEVLNGLATELMSPINKLISHVQGLQETASSTRQPASSTRQPASSTRQPASSTSRSSTASQKKSLAELQQQAELLKTIVSSIDHLVELKQDLQEITPEKTDIRNLVTEAFAESSFWQEQKKLTMHIKFPSQAVLVRSRGVHLKKLLNLLVREVQSACKARSKIQVGCLLDQKKGLVQLRITYQGMRLDKFAESASTQASQKRFSIWLPLLQHNMIQNSGNLEFGESKEGAYVELGMAQDQDVAEIDRTRVLICDENKKDSNLVKKLIFKHWPKAWLLQLTSPFELLDRHDNFKPDLVVIDPLFSQPGWGHQRIMSSLFQQRQHICPVISISTLYKSAAERTVVAERGVSDYMEKPCQEFDLEFKLKRLLILQRRERSLQNTMGIAQRQAYTDFLTGLGNRNHFDDFLKVQISYAKQTDKKCTLIMIDIDHFKNFNDTHGHQLGDELLRRIGQILQKSIRSSDLAARYGGEEFVLVLPETNKDMGATIAEKVRKSIESINIPEANQQPLGVISASFGVACFNADGKDPAALIHWADKCLYAAKEAGRNRVLTKILSPQKPQKNVPKKTVPKKTVPKKPQQLTTKKS